jgi:hypothetical protein
MGSVLPVEGSSLPNIVTTGRVDGPAWTGWFGWAPVFCFLHFVLRWLFDGVFKDFAIAAVSSLEALAKHEPLVLAIAYNFRQQLSAPMEWTAEGGHVQWRIKDCRLRGVGVPVRYQAHVHEFERLMVDAVHIGFQVRRAYVSATLFGTLRSMYGGDPSGVETRSQLCDVCARQTQINLDPLFPHGNVVSDTVDYYIAMRRAEFVNSDAVATRFVAPRPLNQ